MPVQRYRIRRLSVPATPALVAGFYRYSGRIRQSTPMYKQMHFDSEKYQTFSGEHSGSEATWQNACGSLSISFLSPTCQATTPSASLRAIVWRASAESPHPSPINGQSAPLSARPYLMALIVGSVHSRPTRRFAEQISCLSVTQNAVCARKFLSSVDFSKPVEIWLFHFI